MKILTNSEISVRLVESYIKHIESLYADAPEYEAERLLLVLRIHRFVLRHRINPARSQAVPLETIKHGVRQAEIILQDIQENEPAMMFGWYMGCTATNPAQRLCNVLSSLILELTKELVHIEEQYPELKFVFERERARYRRLKNDYDEAVSVG